MRKRLRANLSTERTDPMSIQTMLASLSQGFLTTLAIFFLTLLGSLPLGLIVYFARKSRFSPLRWEPSTFTVVSATMIANTTT